MKKLMIWVMLSCLILTLGVGPTTAKAETALAKATLLKVGQETTLETGTEEKNTYWYRVNHEAGVEKNASHFELSIDTDQPVQVTAYPSEAMAAEDDTFDRYRTEAEPDEKN